MCTVRCQSRKDKEGNIFLETKKSKVCLDLCFHNVIDPSSVISRKPSIKMTTRTLYRILDNQPRRGSFVEELETNSTKFPSAKATKN